MRGVNSAYDFIRKKILNGDYAPGAPLTADTLAAEIGVSRTPVRDALRMLEMDGLVVIKSRLGASVKKLEFDEFLELCELRLALETQTAGLAARKRTEADLHEIAYAIDGMRRLTPEVNASPGEHGMAELAREDVRFHIAIMNAAKNSLIKREILRLHLINRVAVSPFSGRIDQEKSKAERDARRLEVLEVHEKVFEAIARRDVAAAKYAMEVQLQNLIDRVVQSMARTENGRLARELTPEELMYSS